MGATPEAPWTARGSEIESALRRYLVRDGWTVRVNPPISRSAPDVMATRDGDFLIAEIKTTIPAETLSDVVRQLTSYALPATTRALVVPRALAPSPLERLAIATPDNIRLFQVEENGDITTVSLVPRTKQEVLSALAVLVCRGPWHVAAGSSEPREALLETADALGIGVTLDATKPEIAEAIASAGGEDWDASCDSRNTPSGGGGTVTLEGLRRVLRAVIAVRLRRPSTKQEALDRIASLICRTPRQASIGSSEPREALVDIIDALDLDIDKSLPKPALAEKIARAGGQPWDGSCDSRDSPSGGGSTVTLEGLTRVLRAVVTLRFERALSG